MEAPGLSDCSLEVRGFVGATPSFRGRIVEGGDIHVMLEGGPFGVGLGLRGAYGQDGADLLVLDADVRTFSHPDHRIGVFRAIGVEIGRHDGPAPDSRSALILGPYAEAGIEWPRTSSAAVVTSARVDLGYESLDPTAGVDNQSGTVFAMASLQVGLLLDHGSRAWKLD